MAAELVVQIRADADVLIARQKARELAKPLNFSASDLTLIATAISEVARNIVTYAKHGQIVLGIVTRGRRRGIRVVAQDEGPGIPDIARAMEDGYSTSSSLGLGLPGSKRLMDEFDVVSTVGKGTTVTLTKWGRGAERCRRASHWRSIMPWRLGRMATRRYRATCIWWRKSSTECWWRWWTVSATGARRHSRRASPSTRSKPSPAARLLRSSSEVMGYAPGRAAWS